MKRHILIVEDEAILYRRLRNFLEKHRYSVDDYTPDVRGALTRIARKKPDLVLLDIQLQGEQTGIDLAKILDKKYRIPYIFVTEWDDFSTFHLALGTNMEDYIVKTKPSFNKEELLRKILIVLNRLSRQEAHHDTKGVLALTGYLSEIREESFKNLTEAVVPYKDILYFEKDYEKLGENKPRGHINYTRIITKNGKDYLAFKSIKQLTEELPFYFVRINERNIVNIDSEWFEGKLNGSGIKIGNRYLLISKTYKAEFQKRLEHYYLSMKRKNK